MKYVLPVVIILVLCIQSSQAKIWKDFYACQKKCRTEKECDGKCAKDFNQKCNIFKEGLIGEEESCEYIKEFWDDVQNQDVSDSATIPEEYGEKWIECYGKCINSLDDGYSVAYAECYQGCAGNILNYWYLAALVLLVLVYM